MASDDFRSFGDNPTGAGDHPVLSTAQIQELSRPGGREQHPGGTPLGKVGVDSARPGAQEGGAKSAGSTTPFARPGGPEGVH